MKYVATKDISQCSTDATKDKWGICWKIEEFQRELKQTTGVEGCECRKQRIQRNHVACCMLVWVTLKDYAYKCKKTIYQLKEGLLHNYRTCSILKGKSLITVKKSEVTSPLY